MHAVGGEKLRIAKELAKPNICRWIPLEEVHQVRGQLLLNGLFGVAKPSLLPDNRPVLRLIMNLVPVNSVTRELKLPSITSWQSTILEEGQQLKVWQSDMSSAFSLFRIPQQWGKFLSCNIVAGCQDLGLSGDGSMALCSNVIPMGWSNSVGIMQEMAEALLYRGGLKLEAQIRRGSPLPEWISSS